MSFIKVVDFPTKYLVGRVEEENDFIFFLRIDNSLKEMIMRARDCIKNLSKEYKAVHYVSFIDYTPEYLNNKDKRFLNNDLSSYYANVLPFDVDDYFESNGTGDRLMLSQSHLEVSEYGFVWIAKDELNNLVRTPCFDFSVLNEI